MTVARSVARAVASPVAKAVSGGDGGITYRNELPWSNFTGAASSVPGPAAAPTGMSLFGNTGAQTLLGAVGAGQGVRFECTAQRQYWSGSSSTINAGDIIVFSFYVDAITGSFSKTEIPRLYPPIPSGSTLHTDTPLTISAAGRYFQQYTTGTTGVWTIRFGLGIASNQTGALELSRPMMHIVSSPIASVSEIPAYIPGL